MSEVKRVPQSISGVPDGVEIETGCVVTEFLKQKMKQRKTACSIKASWTTGVCSVSFADGNIRKMVSVRLDELCSLLAEAANAKVEMQKASSGKSVQ